MEGIIARIYPDKGFGFIKSSQGIDFFFHRNSVKGVIFENLNPSDKVTFDEEESDKGPRAGNVRLR